MDTRTPRSYELAEDRPDVRTRLGRTSPRLRIIGAVVLAVIVGLLIWSFFIPDNSKRELPPPPVRVGQVAVRPVTIMEHTTGTIVANATVNVLSRVEGQVISTPFTEGQIVHKGDLLFQLDPRPFQAAVEQAVATQNRDQASLVSAEHDAVRYQALVKQGAVSQSQADQFTAQAKALAATVVADKANVDAARLNLLYSAIRAPIDGKTGPILIQLGNVVPANGTNPLVVITQVQPVKVSFFLPQSELPRIQDQMRSHRLFATVEPHDAAQDKITAPVDFIGNAVDNATGTVELRATFANQDYHLVPGQLLDVSVSLAQVPHALSVPREAVNTGPNGRYVYALTKDNVAQMVPVNVIYDDGQNDAVDGKLHTGDRVITDGQLRVIPGKPVVIAKGKPPPPVNAGNPGSAL
ncbi:MAG TPA: efflux RND transporter periplasmic adaptor subunit [Rhizomicrobium sp.]|jgi:multidrug efflux system membrane fusion protein